MLIIFDLDNTLYDRTGLDDGWTSYTKVGGVKPFPGVKSFLTNFSGVKILVTKQSGDSQQRKIDILGLRYLFDAIFICYTNEEKRKYFQQVIKDYPAGSFWVIGDRIDAEIRYGNELGLNTIRIKHGKYKNLKARDHLEVPDYEIESFLELKELITS